MRRINIEENAGDNNGLLFEQLFEEGLVGLRLIQEGRSMIPFIHSQDRY